MQLVKQTGLVLPSHLIIMVVEVNVFGSQSIALYEIVVARWALVLGIACQHAL